MRGAFTVSDPAAVNLKHILLIDDIITTGATARAASLALARAGAASVWVATLARAGRIYGRRGSLARFDDAEEISEFAGDAPAAIMQGAFQLSSHEPTIFLTRV